MLASAIFLGALLLFLVQPMIGKFLLPWYGGSPGVWTVCMLFFQVGLLGGYAYVHLTTRWLRPRLQAGLHLVLLGGSLLILPLAPAAVWRPEPTHDPTGRILLFLGATIGLPYFVLSTTGPLLQRWYSLLRDEAPPYRLFALSNAGSLLALLAYPFALEPALSRIDQTRSWSVGMAVFALLCGACALRVLRWGGDAPEATPPPGPDARPPARAYLLWLALPTIASLMLLATTQKLSQEVAVVPFLWVLPLALYLLSFILCFESSRWYRRTGFAVALLIGIAEYHTIFAERFPTALGIGALSVLLFVVCMICHGELYRLRPTPRHLTAFYLMVAAGGALGGVLVALVAPLFLLHFEEFEIGLMACAALLLVVHWFDASSPLHAGRPRVAWACLALAWVGLGASLVENVYGKQGGASRAARNFYGSLYVLEREDPPGRELMSGTTRHGFQLHDHPDRPTSYYTGSSGVGLALRGLAEGRARHLGVVGLGVGTLAAYVGPQDRARFYEINPLVVDYARNLFSFLADARGPVEVVLGDARLSLEREPPQGFDLLVLDAFTSDAIPVHLLTVEAFEAYLRHLRPGGVIAVHVSNRHVDLEPVLGAAARHFGLAARVVADLEWRKQRFWAMPSVWVLLCADEGFFARPPLLGAARALDDGAELRLWTDDYTALARLLR